MSQEHPTYFLCSRIDVPVLVERAKTEAEQLLKEFETFYNTAGKLGITIEPKPCLRGYSINGKLTWDGKTISEESDCGLIFLELNNIILSRMIQLGFPSFGKEADK